MPINELQAPPEIADVLSRSGARHFVTDARLGAEGALGSLSYDQLAGHRKPSRAVFNDGELRWLTRGNGEFSTRDMDEIAAVVFTSGSTSRPKGALLTHEGLVGVGHYAMLSVGMGPDDALLNVLPGYHVAGIANSLLAAGLSGAKCVSARFHPTRVLEYFERDRISVTLGFGPMFEAILNSPRYSPSRHPNWRVVALSQTSDHLIRRLRTAGVERIAYGLGMTETSGDFTFSRPWLPDADAVASVGVPLPGLDVQVVDPASGGALAAGEVGELRVKGWSLCRGYIDGSTSVDTRGYWKTGDLGYVRPNGTIQFTGRIKFMVKTGGENVSAYEVEHFLLAEISEVEQAVVVGVPDDRWGEKVVAFVSFAAEQSLTEDDLRMRCKGKIAGYKVPKNFISLTHAEWPLLPAGKIDRSRLAQLALDRLRSGLPRGRPSLGKAAPEHDRAAEGT